MSRPIIAQINLAAFRNNLAVARRYAGGAKVVAVIKANGYGHGTLRAAKGLSSADCFGLLNIEAAAELREAGYVHPILMLEGMFESAELDAYRHLHLMTVVHSRQQVDWVTAAKPGRAMDVFLKVNTGMNRLGFRPPEALDMLKKLQASPNIGRIGLMTHFATADDDQHGIDWQLALFDEAFGGLTLPISLANSAALMGYPQAQGDWVRPGIMLYGSSPFADKRADELGLQPVMTLLAQVISVQHLKAGDYVGYGGTFRADRPMRIGTVACGYADGYPRHAPTGTPVLVEGRRSSLLGRVSMDMLCVDLTHLPHAGIGSGVTLWGEGLSVDEVATSAGTIGYELLCALAPRVTLAEI